MSAGTTGGTGTKAAAFQPLVDDVPYHICYNDDIRKLEESELQKALDDLRSELQDNEITEGIKRPVSSVKLPKDINHFRLERDHTMRSALQVCQPHPITLQKDLMNEELGLVSDESLGSDYSPESLPLLLHQFFLDRIWQLVQSKHLHMLRWKRFGDNTKVMELMYPSYRERLLQIRKEYDDCRERAERLSKARDYFLTNKDSPVEKVEVSDIIIYLQWLISHHHSMKKFACYLKVLQWLPIASKDNFELRKEEVAKEQDQVENITARYRNMGAEDASLQSNSVFLTSMTGEDQPPSPPLKNPFLRTTSFVSISLLDKTTSEAAGGGLASDEHTQGMPSTNNETDKFRAQLNFLVHLYKIGIDVDTMKSAAQEMELYASVLRKFRQIYSNQERMKTFKRYDTTEPGHENWGTDSCNEALTQDSNWLKFVKLKPEKNLDVERKLTDLRNNQKVDGLLEAFSKFVHVSDPDRVNETVKQHAEAAKDPPNILSVDVRYQLERSGKKQSYTTMDLWKIIYTNNDLFSREYEDKEQKHDNENEAKDTSSRPRSSTARVRRNSYDFTDAVNLLGLEEPEEDETESSNMQGAYLSYLLLRQLRIRDLQRTCLSIFNYFRSIERTLTINDGGLSLEGGKAKQASPQKHRRGVIGSDASGFNGNIGVHDYIHNTPDDFKIREVEFMEFEELENHDDFYTMQDGRVHVQDQRGLYIMYDSAITDLRKREKDLLLIASHYLEKGKSGKGTAKSGGSLSSREVGDLDIEEFSRADADRFGILLDLWSNETAFLESKKQLIDAHLEAYQNIFDRDDKRLMAQTITNLFHRQPRLDLDSNYFVKTYRLECVCLRMEAELTKSVLDAQIEDQRNYINKYGRRDQNGYGLPHFNPQKCPISVNLTRSALKNIYLMEFHPSLSIASRLPIALTHAYREVHQVHQPRNATEELVLQRRLLEAAQEKWDAMQLEHVNTDDPIRKELFSDEVAIEDPHFMKKLLMTVIQQGQESGGMRKQKDTKAILAGAGKLLDLVTMRYRLMEAVYESNILAKIYMRQASSLGHGPNHLHLGPPIEAMPDPRLANVLSPIVDGSEDIILESFSASRPGNLVLAIHELDNTDVGRLLFGGALHMEQFVQRPGSSENLHLVLTCQLVHRNTLVTAVQMADAYQVNLALPKKLEELNECKVSEKPDSAEEQKLTPAQFSSYGATQAKRHPFFSVHLAKKPIREKFLSELGRKRDPKKKPEEMESIKRSLFKAYCNQLQLVVAEYSMRGQMVSCYNSILTLLGRFPALRKEHFMIGEPFETSLATLEELDTEPGKISPRPRSLTTEDGRHVVNLWYVPHPTSLMTMFRNKKGGMSEDQCRHVLQSCVRIVAALHDVLQYLCAVAGMGSIDKSRGDGPAADHWGGTKEIVSELIQLQKQVDQLDIRGKPDVSKIAEFLTLRRDVMLMQFDATLRIAMTETFLATENVDAFKALKDCMHFGLYELSNTPKPCAGSALLNVPEPLNPDDIKSKLLFPWRSFINRNGPFGVHFWPQYLVGQWLQLCLAGLKDSDRQVANGEMLGVALLLEDVVSSMTLEDLSQNDSISSRPSSRSSHDSRPASSLSSIRKPKEKVPAKKPLSKAENPVESFQVMKRFLLLWKRLEVCKYHWGLQRLSLDDINSPEVYEQFAQEYRSEILWPVMKRHGHAPLISDNDIFQLPHGVSEMDIRKEQMMKVLEAWECQMILQVKKKLVKETNLVRVEHNSMEVSLPTVDAWKRQVIKDNFTIERPHIAEDFIIQLMQEAEDTGTTVTFAKEHLTSALNDLARNIMARERFAYDSYSMHYENLLRIYHTRLYQKEQEIKQARDQYEVLQRNLQVEVQCHLADTCHDLLLELTALRSKVNDMRTSLSEQDSRARDKVRTEYSGLIKDLFDLCVHLQQELDGYRLTLYNDIRAKIKQSKEKGIGDIILQKRNALAMECDESELQKTRETLDAEGRLKAENHQLSVQLSQAQAENSKALNETNFHLQDMKRQLHKETQNKKIFEERLRMGFEKRLLLVKQQLEVLRNTFRDSIRQSLQVKSDLNKELKVKKDKLHAAQQSAQSQSQLERARKADYEKRLGKLEKEESKLRVIVDEQEKERRLQSFKQDKIKKEVSTIKKQLNHERSMKLEAFHRVDDLQTMIYDAESFSGTQLSRPQTALTAGSRSKSRIGSAARIYTSGSVSGGIWPPPPLSWPNARSLTPGPGAPPDHATLDKKVQRPKTTMGRLRGRIAEQLLNDLDPPEHQETVIKLRELQQLKEKTFITT